MSDPITFVRMINGPTRTDVLLGSQIVGIIEEYPTSYLTALGTIRAHYKLLLPNIHGTTRPATSVAAARQHLLQWLAGWFYDAGPHCAALAEAIAIQALQGDDAERAPQNREQEDDDNARRSLHAANPR